VAGGGIVFGFFIGYCVYQILKKINNHLLEVTITIVLTFGTPLLAEHFPLSRNIPCDCQFQLKCLF